MSKNEKLNENADELDGVLSRTKKYNHTSVNSEKSFDFSNCKRNITLLLTIYNNEEKDLSYWKKIYKELKNNNFPIHILVDCPNTGKIEWVQEKDLYINANNKGKLLSVYDHIKSGFIKTDYFKTVDPDDRISLINLFEFKLPEKLSIIRMLNVRTHEILPNDQKEVERLFDTCEKVRWNNFGTSWTILPTKSILNDTFFDGRRIDINEDQILGQLSYSNNYPIHDTEQCFYLYKIEGGVSSVENFPKYLSYLPNTLKAWKEIKKESNVSAPIDWPGNFGYYISLKERFEENFRKLSEEENEIWDFIQKYKEN